MEQEDVGLGDLSSDGNVLKPASSGACTLLETKQWSLEALLFVYLSFFLLFVSSAIEGCGSSTI